MKKPKNILSLILIFIMMSFSQLANSTERCSYDLDGDGDVDGQDMYLFSQQSNLTSQEYADFADDFGRTGCPDCDYPIQVETTYEYDDAGRLIKIERIVY